STITHASQNGDTGLVYLIIFAVPFNQDSATNNTIRIRAADMSGNMGTQTTPFIVKIDSTPPEPFEIYTPTDWINNQTPMVIIKFYTETSGVNVSTVHFAYETNGNSTPTDWMVVDGVFEDIEYTDPAEDGDTGWLYAKVNAVLFNQDSETMNTIRISVTDIAGNTGIQSIANIIQIDTEPPGAPIGFVIQPAKKTSTNSFNLTWENPSDLSGIIGLYYKFNSPPTSITNGTFIAGEDLTQIIGFSIPGDGKYTIYIWLVDAAGNINHTSYVTATLWLETEPPSSKLLLIILIVAAVAAVVAVIYKTRSRPTRTKVEPKIKSPKAVSTIPPILRTEGLNLEAKLKVLSENKIPIEQITKIDDFELLQLIQQEINTIPPEIKEKILQLDISPEEKMQILEEFKEISEDLQKEFLKELDES
ncbi:MAG TPA: hypothetical protein VMV49_05675, partial [Candidatus Deferrimicrobium sp.]|nr:hypothetical protein [Candidatus Deferrimicrobium sp.]